MLTFKNFNIADWFSFYRIAVAPLLLTLLWLNERELFTWLLLISYSTDAIDGYLARKLKINSARGAIRFFGRPNYLYYWFNWFACI